MTTPLREIAPAPPRRPAWPERIVHLGAYGKNHADPAERERALSELWVLVNAALVRYARQYGRSHHALSEEDLLEIASAKALDLFAKLRSGVWDPGASSPGQLCAFLSTLARHGLVDRLRTRPRRVVVPLGDGTTGREIHIANEESPQVAAERGQFTRALCECLSRLAPRVRRVWLMRACLELSNREIARHPDVRMSPPAVGMALARCRYNLSKCLGSKGFESRDMPRGVFFTLWEAVRHELEGRE